MVKNLPAMQETQIWSLVGKDPLENGMATHSSFLAWRMLRPEEPGGLQSMGTQSQTRLRNFHFTLLHILYNICCYVFYIKNSTLRIHFVCVCVWEREREKERVLPHSLTVFIFCVYNLYLHTNIFYARDFFVVHVKVHPSSGDLLTTGSRPSPSGAVLALHRRTCHLLHAFPGLILT